MIGISGARKGIVYFTAPRGMLTVLLMRMQETDSSDENIKDLVGEVANTISGNAPMTIHAVKYAINEAVKDESARNLKQTAELVEQCFASKDYAEGRKAFMEKRKPVFTGT